MRTVGVVTVARSDYGIYLPVLRKIQEDPGLRLFLIAGGMHLSPEYGHTVDAIEADGFQVNERVEMLLSSDTPEGIAKSVGLGIIGFAQVYARARPDILLVLGDRYEMYAAAVAALPFRIPVAHIHGGEVTQGAMDDALRHSITKLSHLHFVATQEYARRVVQVGEEPWRVRVVGAPSLDNLAALSLLPAEELAVRFGLRSFSPAPLLVTFHPVTLEEERTEWQVGELLAALAEQDAPVVFTLPNADTRNSVVRQRIRTFVDRRPSAQMVDSLGTQGYFSLMALAAAMVGNSSSGIIEAPSLGLPVVNIGTRQQGRVRAANVIDVGYPRGEIAEGIRRALRLEFRESLAGLANPYWAGGAAAAIVQGVRQVPLDSRLIAKRFHDVGVAVPEGVG